MTTGRHLGDPPPATAGRALAWSLTNTMVGRVGTVAIGVVLARILGPDEFGTYAVAFVALIALLSFNELGVSLAIVRWPGHPATIAPTVTTISVGDEPAAHRRSPSRRRRGSPRRWARPRPPG